MEKIILGKINLKIQKLKTKIKPSFTKPILSDPNVVAYLGTLYRKYVMVRIDKANIKFAIICKTFIFLKFLLNLGSIITFNPIPHIQKQNIIKS